MAKKETDEQLNLKDFMPADWRKVLAEEFEKPYIKKLEAFLTDEMANHAIFPTRENLFAAFRHTPYEKVKVVLLGQDPYHNEGQAHGLSFSVIPGVTPPPSLRNIFKELRDDLGHAVPKSGDLTHWA